MSNNKIWGKVLSKIVEEREPHIIEDGSSTNTKNKGKEVAEIFNKPNYEVLKFQIDEGNEVIIAGNEASLALQMSLLNAIASMNIGNSSENAYRFYSRRESVTRHPILYLYFSGKWTSKNYSKSLPKAEINVRLDDFVVNPNEARKGEDVIKESDLRAISKKVIENFAPGGEPMKWEKGYYVAGYKDLNRAIDIRPNVKTETDALKLINATLNVLGVPYDARNFYPPHGPKDLSRFEPKTPVKVLGREFPDHTKTKITGDVYFRSAKIKLDEFNYEVKIVDFNREGKVRGWDEIPR